MYQLMIINGNEVVGVCTSSQRLPDVEEIYPGKGYQGIEVPYNQDMINNYYNYYFDGNYIVPKPK